VRAVVQSVTSAASQLTIASPVRSARELLVLVGVEQEGRPGRRAVHFVKDP
jgi:hypothetical protein